MNRLAEMFHKQRETMRVYDVIEGESGLLQTDLVPVDIATRAGQARLKDFCWRTTEEVIEAVAAFENVSLANMDKVHEEVSDATHFLIELAILSGIEPELIGRRSGDFDDLSYAYITSLRLVVENPDEVDRFSTIQLRSRDDRWLHREIRQAAFHVIFSLGQAANLLKCRPWKRSTPPVDEKAYIGWIRLAFAQFINFAAALGMGPTAMYEGYCGKNEVNKQRQAGTY